MEPNKLPTIAHFGCGRLGTAAVLPFLIHKYGPTHRIIVIQRLSKKWENVPNDTVIPIRTNFGDFMPFHTFRLEESGTISNADSRQLIFVKAISLCHSFLQTLKDSSSELIVTCSLGNDGQGELIQLLKTSDAWDKALIFENTLAREWEEFTEGASKKAYPIIVDRICWHVKPYSSQQGILSFCEDARYAHFDWPVSANIPATLPADDGPHGECVCLRDEFLNAFPDDDVEWQFRRKRALINAPHSIAALLCYRLLAVREMSAENQYLAPLQVMLQEEHPEWYKAMDDYLRLRAIEVAWFRYKNNTEFLHNEFRRSYNKAKEAERRFFHTNDWLDRLMVPKEFGRELSKLQEHIFAPFAFYARESRTVRQKWVYGRPNDVDLRLLREFLDESFVVAGRWLDRQ